MFSTEVFPGILSNISVAFADAICMNLSLNICSIISDNPDSFLFFPLLFLHRSGLMANQ